MAVQPPGRLANVDGEVGGAFDLGDDPQGGDDLAKVGRDGRLQGEEAVAALLDGDAGGVELVVGDDHPLRRVEVLGEEDVGGAEDVLGDGRRQAGDGLADLVEVAVERMSERLLAAGRDDFADVELGSTHREQCCPLRVSTTPPPMRSRGAPGPACEPAGMASWDPGPGIVTYPDGRRMRGRGLRRQPPVPPPDHGVYLVGSDPGSLAWSSRWVQWRDLRTPAATNEAVEALAEAFERAATERVEIACRGGIGRTGCGLALMAIWAGVQPTDAIAWVRAHYHRRAVETPWQRRWVERVGRSRHSPSHHRLRSVHPGSVRAQCGSVCFPSDDRFFDLFNAAATNVADCSRRLRELVEQPGPWRQRHDRSGDRL